MSRVSGDFPVQLATRSPDWSAGGLLRSCGAVLLVCPCVVSCRSPNSTTPTRTTCCCGQVASILIASDTPPDFLVTRYRHPREDDTRKLLPWNFSLSRRGGHLTVCCRLQL